MVIAFLKFLFNSKNEHSIHSPFVYDLYTKSIKKRAVNNEFKIIEAHRHQLKANKSIIEITDFGAGSKYNKGNFRKINKIAKNAEKSPKLGQLLYNLVEYFQPKTVFDLGTSLGITTLYLSNALKNNGQITTFEGCPETAKIAKMVFDDAKTKNIDIIIGNIDITLATQLEKITTLDFVFFDANHRLQPTINYFEMCLSKADTESVFVFDDIHWSKEMEQAWEYIKKHPKVFITIDLFYLGLVFFRTKQPKQHFTLRL